MNYYQRIKDLREDHDYKQTDIAKILGTSRQQVGRWENGLQMMGVDKYVILAKFYNVSADYLLGLIDTPRKLREE